MHTLALGLLQTSSFYFIRMWLFIIMRERVPLHLEDFPLSSFFFPLYEGGKTIFGSLIQSTPFTMLCISFYCRSQ